MGLAGNSLIDSFIPFRALRFLEMSSCPSARKAIDGRSNWREPAGAKDAMNQRNNVDDLPDEDALSSQVMTK